MHIRVYMVKPVSLSDPAFEALREEKQEGESDSDVVLRLIEEARSSRKDPMHFLRKTPQRERALSYEEHLEAIERMDEADREKAIERWENRHGDS
jgi:predicted CopG family antitoxin